MDDARLAEIQQRSDAATEGPWEMGGMDSGHSKYAHDWWITAGDKGDTVCSMEGLIRSQNEELAQDDGNSDAWFISNARTDVVDLLAEVRRLRAVMESLAEMQELEARMRRDYARTAELAGDADTYRRVMGYAMIQEDVAKQIRNELNG